MQAHGFENVHRVDAKTKDCPEYVRHQHLASTPAQKRALPILLSHQFALKTAYEDPARHPFVLVLEDDVSMEFAPFWHHQNLDRFAARLPTGWLAVQLGYSALGTLPQHTPADELTGLNAASDSLRNTTTLHGHPGAFAYLISRAGMRAVLTQSVEGIQRRCEHLTADDCLLGFSALPAHHQHGPLLKGLYWADPPLLTVRRGMESTHFSEKEMQGGEQEVLLAGFCGGLYDNALFYTLVSEHKCNPRGTGCGGWRSAAQQQVCCEFTRAND